MNKYVCRLRVFVISVGLAVSTYGFSALIVHTFLVDSNAKAIYIGLSVFGLLLSHQYIVLPLALIALATYKVKFDPPNIWLGTRGKMVLILDAIISFIAGALIGWLPWFN